MRDPASVLDVLGSTAYADKGVAQLRARVGLVWGVKSGDVTAHEAVLWARGDGPGRLTARLTSGAHVGRVLHGPEVDESSACTGHLDLTGLSPDRAYDASVWFEGRDGTRGEVGHLRFRTAAARARPTSFVWTGGTAGDGWGINPALGGMTGYAAMHRTNPDFLLHAGEAVDPGRALEETRVEPGGLLWRNLVTPEVAKVAETLAEWRGRHAYHLLDDNVRAMYADVPVVALWDPHESRLGWAPGQVLTDERYAERRTDVLAARARRAWQEFTPLASRAVHGRGTDGFAAARMYRRLARGPLLDVFCLDVRYDGRHDVRERPESTGPRLLGSEQADWLVREASRSPATWTVLVGDLPSDRHDDPDLVRVLRGLRDYGVRNVVWLSAGRHAAAYHHDAEWARHSAVEPFWRFVAGPIHAGSSPPAGASSPGPRVVFARGGTPGESPRAGQQFFGHVALDAHAVLTVSLRDVRGLVLHETVLEPVGRQAD